MTSSLTARAGLYKVNPGTGELVDPVKLNNSMDKIDSLLGAPGMTTAARTAMTAFDGQIARETDGTKRLFIRDTPGAAWKQVMMADSPYASAIVSNRPLAADTAFSSTVGAEAQQRLIVTADGKYTWGSGTAVGDTNLYRSAANVLKTDDAMVVTGTLTSGAITAPGAVINSGAHKLLTQVNDLQLAAAYTLTATLTDLPGMSWTFFTLRANALAVCTWHGDFTTTGGTVGTGLLKLNVDTVDVASPQAIFNAANTTAGGRATTGNQTHITLSASGSHTIRLRAQMSGTLGMLLQALHTTLNIQIYE